LGFDVTRDRNNLPIDQASKRRIDMFHLQIISLFSENLKTGTTLREVSSAFRLFRVDSMEQELLTQESCGEESATALPLGRDPRRLASLANSRFGSTACPEK
jgi:hypothetical protein